MASLPKTLVSPQEYLEQQRKAEDKSEYLNGEIFATPGALEGHVLISTNLCAS